MNEPKDPTAQNGERGGREIEDGKSETENPGPHSEFRIPNSGRYLFDNPRNVKRLLRIFYLLLAALLAVGGVVRGHPHFPWEEWPEFYAVYGFIACVVLVVAAKYILRPLVKRDEGYYD